MSRESPGSPASTIFVQVASYRDGDLGATVRSVLGAAADAERVHLGICHQYDDRTVDLLADFDGDPRLRIDAVPYTESQGVGWARARANRLFATEDWFLQIDAHTRLAEGWDELLVDQARSVPSERPLLSIYPAPFTIRPDGTEHRHDPYPHAMRMGLRTMLPDGTTQQLMDEQVGATGPGRQLLLAAGFLFGPGRFVLDVPYDPAWYFNGEEIALAVRAYTHGYDVYYPFPAVAWHRYQHGSPLHWGDGPPAAVDDLTRASRTRLATLFHGDPGALGPYGPGRRRTIGAFERAAGLRFPPPAIRGEAAVARHDLRLAPSTAPGLGDAAPLASSDPAAIQVFGPPNSGTGLLFNLLQALVDPPPRWHWCFRKHSLPPRLAWAPGCVWPEEIDGPPADVLDRALLLGMVRLPAFWLASMVRNPYDTEFLRERDSTPSARLRCRVRSQGRELADLPELWNLTYRAYRDHLEAHGAVSIRLEDLVADPHAVVEQLGRVVPLRDDIDRAETVELVRRTPSKVHGWACWAGDAARARYDPANIEDLWSQADLAYIDERIDPALRARFGYPSVSG